jgi:flagellar basal body P-ring protein FlgI
MVNMASEPTSGRIKHGAEISRNLRVSKASKQASVSVTLRGCDFHSDSVNKAVKNRQNCE